MSVIKCHGGKTYLAQKIIDLMPPHTRYCEPFFGGGAVLFQKPCEGVAEFVNDVNGRLMNFWRILQCSVMSEEFIRQANMTPLAMPEFRWSLPKRSDPILDALAFFVHNRQSRQGLGATTARQPAGCVAA